LGLSKRTAERYVAKALDHCLMRLALGAQPNRPPRP
jgi:hypothetical protein